MAATYRLVASNTRKEAVVKGGMTLAEAEALKQRMTWNAKYTFLILRIEAEEPASEPAAADCQHCHRSTAAPMVTEYGETVCPDCFKLDDEARERFEAQAAQEAALDAEIAAAEATLARLRAANLAGATAIALAEQGLEREAQEMFACFEREGAEADALRATVPA